MRISHLAAVGAAAAAIALVVAALPASADGPQAAAGPLRADRAKGRSLRAPPHSRASARPSPTTCRTWRLTAGTSAPPGNRQADGRVLPARRLPRRRVRPGAERARTRLPQRGRARRQPHIPLTASDCCCSPSPMRQKIGLRRDGLPDSMAGCLICCGMTLRTSSILI